MASNPIRGSSFFLKKSDYLGCIAFLCLVVNCMTLLAFFFLLHLSLTCTCTCTYTRPLQCKHACVHAHVTWSPGPVEVPVPTRQTLSGRYRPSLEPCPLSCLRSGSAVGWAPGGWCAPRRPRWSSRPSAAEPMPSEPTPTPPTSSVQSPVTEREIAHVYVYGPSQLSCLGTFSLADRVLCLVPPEVADFS